MAIDQYTPRKTLSRENQACIKCPLFGVETKLAACYALDAQVMRGREVPVRKGCQAAMRSGKCAARVITKTIFRDNSDPFFSEEKHVFAVPQAIINELDPILVLDRTLDQFAVPDAERALIMAKNGRGKLGGGKSVELGEVPIAPKPTRAAKKPAAAPKPDETHDAAVTGDMSAAISAAASQRPAEKPAGGEVAASTGNDTRQNETPPAASQAPATGTSLLEQARRRNLGAAA